MPINLNLPAHPGLFITGTDTGVGKTVVAGAIAKILTDAGTKVGVFRPIATGCYRSWDGLISQDTQYLANCANSDLPLSTITPVGYFTDAVPVISAAREKRPVDFQTIAAAYKQICQQCQVIIVEGIGGVRVPLTLEFDLLDLAVEFNLPVVIVARSVRGTLNHTLMTLDCIRATPLEIAGVVINGYDGTKSTPDEDIAAQLVAQFGQINILSEVPFDDSVSFEQFNPGQMVVRSMAHCDWKKLAQVP
ncbi:MAG TPA: dethiobiotin synthase [Sedimentisphaerales bacterium]|nr:dethiobiotin synthase [Sedimentisphaerales bacterium]